MCNVKSSELPDNVSRMHKKFRSVSNDISLTQDQILDYGTLHFNISHYNHSTRNRCAYFSINS